MRGQPISTTLRDEDFKYVEGLAKALGISLSSTLEDIVHRHIVAEVQRLTKPTRKQK